MCKREQQVLLKTDNVQLEQALGLYASLFLWKPTYTVRFMPDRIKLLPLLKNLKEQTLSTKKEFASVLASFDKILCNSLDGIDVPVMEKKCVKISDGSRWSSGNTGGCEKCQITLKNDGAAASQIGIVVCQVLQEIQSRGYDICVETDSPKLVPFLSLLKPLKRKPDISVFITERSDLNSERTYDLRRNRTSQVQDISEYLLSRCRGVVNIEQYIQRHTRWLQDSVGRYIKWLKYIGEGSGLLYKTVNRSTVKVPPEIICLYSQLCLKADIADRELKTESEAGRSEWEWIYQTCYYEYHKEKEYMRQLSSPFVIICNLPDTIVSFLGARKCNMRCGYCFSEHGKQSSEKLTVQDMVHTLEFCRELSGAEYIHIDNYLGGEPCLEFETVKRVHTAMHDYKNLHKLDFSFGLLTNGTVMKEEQLNWSRENTPYIGLSLDGDQKTNDNIRVYPDGKGTYKNAVQFIKKIKEKNWPVPIGVSCVLTANEMDIVRIFRHIHEELGVPYVTIKPVRAGAEKPFALTLEKLPDLKESYHVFVDYLIWEAENGNLKPLFAILHPIDYLGRFLARTGLEDRVIVKRCGAGEHIFSIDNAHRVYACDSFNGKTDAYIGTWEEGRTGAFRTPFVTENSDLKCMDCWCRYSCGGVCSYVRYLNHGEITEVVQFECEFTKFLVCESLLFWEKIKKKLPGSEIDRIYRHMEEMGFSKFKKDRDHFYYAPC